jgi:hypothetical protein
MPQKQRPNLRLRPAKSQLRAPRLTALERRIPRRRRALAGFKNPLLARAGGQTVGGSIPGGRATRGIAPIVFLGLIFLGSRLFVSQNLGVSGQIERVARRQYIPELEKQLGTKIEVGDFSTDWLGRVQINNIVVGRDDSLPTGALLQAKSATVSLDLISLALRRKAVIDAISRIDIDSPELYIERATSGKFNFQDLSIFKGDAKGGAPTINTKLGISNGRVYFIDRSYTAGSGQPLLVDARQINASVQAEANAPYRFSGTVGSSLLGRERFNARNIGFSGVFDTNNPAGFLRVQTPWLPARLVGDYAFRKREVNIQDGTVQAEIQLAISGNSIVPRGIVEARDVDFLTAQLREPRAGKQNAGDNWRVANANGTLQFAGEAVRTENLSFRALDANWNAAGAVSIDKGIAFDVRIQSPQVPVRRLVAFADPKQIPVDLQTKNTKLDTQISGDLNNLNIAGSLQSGATSFRLKDRNLNGQTSDLRLLFALKTAPKVPVRFAARAAMPSASVRGQIPVNGKTQTGEFVARGLLISTRGAANSSPIELGIQAKTWRVSSGSLGSSDGQNLRLAASTANLLSSNWHGSITTQNAATNRINLAAFSPQASEFLESSGRLDINANFGGVGSTNPFVDADFLLRSLSIRPSAVPVNFRSQVPAQVIRELLSLNQIRGQLALRNGQIALRNASVQTGLGEVRGAFAGQKFAVDLPLGSLASRQLNAVLISQGLALDANWTGRVAIASGNTERTYDSQFVLRAPSAILKSGNSNRAQLRKVELRGAIQLQERRIGRNTWNAKATITADELSLRAGKWGATSISLPQNLAGTRLREGKIVVNATQEGWNAQVNAARIAVQNPLVGQPPLTFVAPSILAKSSGKEIELSRVKAKWGLGIIDGTATIRDGRVSARVLAREIEASALQNLVAASSRRDAKVSGKISALATLTPGRNPVLQFQMPTGRADVTTQSISVPISAFKGEVEVTPNSLLLRDTSFWSQGAKVETSGFWPLVQSKIPTAPVPNAKIRVTGFRLNRIPLSDQLREGIRADGLVSGEFSVSLGETPSLKGTTTARGVTLAGTDISQAQGKVEVYRDPEGWRMALVDWNGIVEDAPFKADLESDLAQNYWRLTLSTPELAARRVALLQARATRKEGAIPLEGDFMADIDINGEFNSNEGNANHFWIPRAGYAILQSKNVRWRGRSAGALNADFAFLGDVARINKLEFNPPPEAALPTIEGDEENVRPRYSSPKVEIKGVLPLTGDSQKLDATIDVGEAPLQFFREAINEAALGLRQLDIEVPALQRAITYTSALPEGTRGRIALQGSLEGSWDQPSIRVTNLTLRDGQAPLPQGGLSAPAKLDAAFSYKEGVLQIENSAFQIEKTADERAEGEENTILRVAKGGIDPSGNIDISADVFNANLSQLSTWIPALRDANGSPLVRGTLTDFSVSAGGTVDNPEITGSIQAENLAAHGYSLDQILVSRFEIKDGFASINPGNLTISKGRFSSRSAYAKIPFDWNKRGFVQNAPIQAGVDLQTKDFIALASVLVPQLREVSAEEISGSLGVRGTLEAPQLVGDLNLRQLAFQIQKSAAPFPVALSGLSGKLSFLDGNRLVIDAANPIKGKLAGASVVEAKATKANQGKTKSSSSTPNPRLPEFQAGGEFSLGGEVDLDLSSATLALGARGFNKHNYNLAFSIANAAVSSSLLAGFRDGDAALLFKTGADGLPTLRWMLAARGAKTVGQKRGGGELLSFGNLKLRSDFAVGTNQLLRSEAQEFDSISGFEDYPVAKRIKLSDFPDRRPQVLLKTLEWGYTGVGKGEFVGRIVLDNRVAVRRPTAEAQQVLNTQRNPQPINTTLDSSLAESFEKELRTPRRIGSQPWLRFNIGEDRRPAYRTGTRIETDLFGAPTEEEISTPQNRDVLRIGGDITLQNSDIFGAPSGEGGSLTRLSVLPAAPRFDISLVLGEKVNFVNSVFRTGLRGELVASGTPQNPQILGTVELRDGAVRFPNARARIGEGTLNVAITRDPETDLLRSRVEVDAEATGNSGIYQVTLKLRGPLDLSGGDSETDRLQVDVTSNPPLAQSEAFAQLLGIAPGDFTSRGGNGDVDFNSGRANQAYAQAVLQFVAAPFFDGFERTVADALGLTSVGFEYRFNEPLAIQLSKALGDRVFVSYRRSLGTTAGSTGDAPEELRIDYRIRGNYTVGLKINEQNVYGLTLQRSWRF